MGGAGRVADLDAGEGGNECEEVRVHRRDDGGGLGAAADVGLVGGNHENEARSGEGSAGLGDAGEELELSEGVRRVGFAVADDLTIQRAVAVEEDGGAGWLGRGRGHGIFNHG